MTTTQTTFYTSSEKVAEFMNLSVSGATTFSDATEPTKKTVEQYIRRAEAEVNRFTRNTWKEQQTPDYEYLDSAYIKYYSTGLLFKLEHSSIEPLDSTKGDILEFWNGLSYDDWIQTKTEGRNDDYWFDYIKGILFVRNDTLVRPYKVRIIYRYNSGGTTTLSASFATATATASVNDTNKFPYSGTARLGTEYFFYETKTSASLFNCVRGIDGTTATIHVSGTTVYHVPEDIERATTMLTAAQILEFEDATVLIPEGAEKISTQQKHDILRRDAKKLLAKYVKPVVVKQPTDLHLYR